MRLDLYLVNNEYFKSRAKAQEAIKEGNVFVDGKKMMKSNYDISNQPLIEIKNPLKYVSRGGLKLEKAIQEFHLDFKDKIVLDIGASRGGFTDCALQFGAKRVYSVDVGRDQLDSKLKEDPRVISYEQTNILDTSIQDKIDFIVMDVSFVSIYHLLPAIKKYLNDNNLFICLIKPQFEYGKMVGKGIIKNPHIHLEVLENVNKYLNEANLYIQKLVPSPIKGGSGNIEFLAQIGTNKKGNINLNEVISLAHRG